MKLKVQAQHLQPGDIVGSGERVTGITINSINWPSNKVLIGLQKNNVNKDTRGVLWGKYTMINVERADAPIT